MSISTSTRYKTNSYTHTAVDSVRTFLLVTLSEWQRCTRVQEQHSLQPQPVPCGNGVNPWSVAVCVCVCYDYLGSLGRWGSGAAPQVEGGGYGTQVPTFQSNRPVARTLLHKRCVYI